MRESILTHEFYKRAIEDAAEVVDRLVREAIPDDPQFDNVASPLEAVFAVWWRTRAIFDAFEGEVCPELWPQRTVKVGESTYRLDFSIETDDPQLIEVAKERNVLVPLIGVEIDDDASHHNTKIQIEHRNKRDSDLMAAGWHIFHFSQSEILTKPQQCVDRVHKHAVKALRHFARVVQKS